MQDWKNVKDTETVCYCIGITKKTIVEAIEAGSDSLAKIKKKYNFLYRS